MSSGSGTSPTEAVLFIIVCFTIGCFTKFCLVQWTRVPYTALLLLWGLGIGLLQSIPPVTLRFSQSLSLWMGMDPHLLLLVFLPTIAFSAGINQEPHMLRKSWLQIMLLAWPGVVVCFILIGCCAKYFFPYGWDWTQSLLFGAMMSATDPVAVVAVLQEVGASQKLAVVIDGESLMNDGSALVMFLLLQRLAEGQHLNAAQVVTLFCNLALGGMALGIGFGLVTSLWLSRIYRDPTIMIVITFLSAYSSFYVAENLCGASGLLAVVCNGFTMSWIGGRQIAMRVQHSMHAFWGVLEWAANTLLFIWVGIALAFVLHPPPGITTEAVYHGGMPAEPGLDGGAGAAPHRHLMQDVTLEVEPSYWPHRQYLVPSDAGYAVVLFLWLIVVRAFMILLFWYPFRFTGYPLTWQSFLVMVWAGLRGAVGMAMALFILLDPGITDSRYKTQCVFYMACMAFFTVLLNGGTCKWLLRKLGFMSHTPEQLRVLEHVVEDLDEIREEYLARVVPNEVLGDPDWDAVRVWTALDVQSMLDEVRRTLVPHKPPVLRLLQSFTGSFHVEMPSETELAAVNGTPAGSQGELPSNAAAASAAAVPSKPVVAAPPELVFDLRCRLLRMVKAEYAKLFNTHLLGTLEISTLHEVTDTALDRAELSLCDWRLLCTRCQPSRLVSWLATHHMAASWLTPLVQSLVYNDTLHNIQLLAAFIEAHGRAQQLAVAQMQVAEDEYVAGTPSRSCQPSSHPGTDPGGEAASNGGDVDLCQRLKHRAAAAMVLGESRAEVEAAFELAQRLVQPHPSLPNWLRTKACAATVLQLQHEFLERISEAGMVEPREIMALEELVHNRGRELVYKRTALAAAFVSARSRVALRDLPLFEALSDVEAEQLMGGRRTLRHLVHTASLHHAVHAAAGSSNGDTHPASWTLFRPGQLLTAPLGTRIEHIVVIATGAAIIRYPKTGSASRGSDAIRGMQSAVSNHRRVPGTAWLNLTERDSDYVIASVGDAIGLADLLLDAPCRSIAVADALVEALVVPAPALRRLLASNPAVAQRAWQQAAAVVAARRHMLGDVRALAPLNLFFRSCAVVHVPPKQVVKVRYSALLLTGSVALTGSSNEGAEATNAANGSHDDGGGATGNISALSAPAELSTGLWLCVSASPATLLLVPYAAEVPSAEEADQYRREIVKQGWARLAHGKSIGLAAAAAAHAQGRTDGQRPSASGSGAGGGAGVGHGAAFTASMVAAVSAAAGAGTGQAHAHSSGSCAGGAHRDSISDAAAQGRNASGGTGSELFGGSASRGASTVRGASIALSPSKSALRQAMDLMEDESGIARAQSLNRTSRTLKSSSVQRAPLREGDARNSSSSPSSVPPQLGSLAEAFHASIVRRSLGSIPPSRDGSFHGASSSPAAAATAAASGAASTMTLSAGVADGAPAEPSRASTGRGLVSSGATRRGINYTSAITQAVIGSGAADGVPGRHPSFDA